MPRRVAITIAGAVSLGAYEAGVMYELLEAFRRHNDECDQNATPGDKIYVDVITGASAGGMTAAMLAETLMFRGAELSDAQTNPLYRAWVKRISLEGLVHLDTSEPKWNSLLSSNLITKIGTEMLVDPMKSAPTGPHNCLQPGAPLRIGMALTNLNGVNYMIPIEGIDEGGFNYTSSVDQRLFVVYPDRTSGLDILTPDGQLVAAHWEHLRAAAVACGAFPFAFRPQEIHREKTEFVNEVTPEWPPEKIDPGTTYVTLGDSNWDFTYTDGGVLQNQPLGIAKNLVDASVEHRLTDAKKRAITAHGIDAAMVQAEIGNIHRDADDRIYVFVSPNEVKSSAIDLVAAQINLEEMLPDVLHVYLRQATFHDWIMAESVNQKIRILDDRARDLAKTLQEGRILNVRGFYEAADNLNDLMLKGKKAETYERLSHQYTDLLGELKNQPDRDALIAGVATLESAAHLGDRDKMHIIAVLADSKRELAGSGISSFVGFFSETYREHDYRVGRHKARKYLVRKDVSTLLQLDVDALHKFYKEHPIPPMDPPLAVPVKLDTALEAGKPWLLYAVWIRAKWLPVALLVLLIIAYLMVAHYHQWWPFHLAVILSG